MIIANVVVQTSSASAQIRDHLPVGASGLKVQFQFAEPRWNKLSKTAVFRNRDVTIDAIVLDNCAVIPHEVLTNAMDQVDVGIYGTDSDHAIAIPTVWTKLGTVMSAANPSDQLSADPTAPYWVQVKEQVDQVQDLMMTQEDLEEALIRARESGEFNGPRGEKGETPQKGVDYWNAADIAQIKSFVDEAILGGAW